jgi:hypothetical protein
MVPDQDHRDGDQPSPPQQFAGVDWGGSSHQLCVIDGDGVLILQQRIVRDITGLEFAGQPAPGLRRRCACGDRTRGGPAGRVLADSADGHAVLRVAEDFGSGAGTLPGVGVEVGQLRRLVLADTAARARAVAAAQPTFHVDCGVAGGFQGPAAGAAREGGLRVAAAGGEVSLAPLSSGWH